MDDNIALLISVILTIIIGGAGIGILTKLRSFLRNLAELVIAVDNCLDEDCSKEEVKAIVKELQETIDDGLGIWSFVVDLISKVLRRGV
jgi:hypothetical protein